MLMIRFQRTGRRNDPAFRIVALEKTSSPKAGTYTDLLGTYNPRTKAMTVAGDRVKHWVSVGAQLSPSVSNLLISKGVIEGKKVAVVSKTNLEKNKPKAEEVAAAAAAEAAAAAPAEAAPAPEAPAEEAAPAAEPAVEAPTEEAAPAQAAPETPAA